MKVDTEIINEIRNSVDIVEIISNYLPLTSKGKNYFGVCPFHDDHSPSMSVSPEKQIYTCFSCGATGNVFKFLQDYENITFLEALKKCADIAGIDLDIKDSKPKNNKNQELYDIYDLAHKVYQNNINTEYGKKAIEYLKNRKLDDDTIKNFEIGLSLNKNDLITNLLKKKGYSDKVLITSGLVNENNFNLNDVYKNRIMFPLFDLNGKVIGFNGRVYNGETENKYINSKETPIFKKREILYNYHKAKDESRIKKSVIIMEGPMDVIRAYTIGVKNVVATLGTAFGKEQAMLIRKLSNNVILCFDGDDAGLKATKGAIVELEKLGITPKIVRLEDNLDPDEYILKNGKDRFISKLENPMNIMEFKESLLKKSYNLNNSLELSKYVNSMIEEINNIDDDILKEITINKLSEETKLDIDIIRKKIVKKEKKVIEKKSNNQKLNKYQKSEQGLLFYMLKYPEVIKMYDKKITHMPTERFRHLAFKISYFYKCNGYINAADLLTELNDEEESIKTIGEINILNLPDEYEIDQIYDYLENIKEYNEKNYISNLENKLKEEVDLKRKLELANKVVEMKMRREENGRRN